MEQIKCSYCGTVNKITWTMRKEVAASEKVVAFRTSGKDFEKCICHEFAVDDHCENDILYSLQRQLRCFEVR